MSIHSSTLQNIIESICQNNISEQCIRNQITFFNNVMRELKKRSSETDSFYVKLSAKPYVKDLTLQKRFLLIESVIEKVSAEQYILLGKDPVLEEKLQRHTPLMERDGNCLGLTKNSSILLVGSGAIPITGIILCRKFGCRIYCVDSDIEAVELSKELIFAMGLESYFTFLCNDIRSVDLKKINTSATVIVAFLPNKNEIIQKIICNSNNMDLLIRQPRGAYSLIYDKVDNKLFNQLKNVKIDSDFERGHYISVIGRIV